MASKPSALEPPAPEPETGDALEQVYRTHGRWLLGFLRRRFGHDAAQELSQETYLRLAGSTRTLRNPKSFLARVALNLARDHARRRAARPQLTSPANEFWDVDRQLDTEERLAIKEVVLGLPRNLRDVFLLSRFAGLTYRRGAEPEPVGDLHRRDPGAGRNRPLAQLMAQAAEGDLKGFGPSAGHALLSWPVTGAKKGS